MTEYWFARYKPAIYPQRASRGLVPLRWQGVAVIAIFVLCMLLGGGLMLFFGLRDQMIIGVPLFVILAIAGASFFLWASVARTDPKKSIYDYRKERGQ